MAESFENPKFHPLLCRKKGFYFLYLILKGFLIYNDFIRTSENQFMLRFRYLNHATIEYLRFFGLIFLVRKELFL
jgi:hypothetical protein